MCACSVRVERFFFVSLVGLELQRVGNSRERDASFRGGYWSEFCVSMLVDLV